MLLVTASATSLGGRQDQEPFADPFTAQWPLLTTPQANSQAACPYTSEFRLAAPRVGPPLKVGGLTLSGPWPSLEGLVLTLTFGQCLCVGGCKLLRPVARLPVLTSWLIVVSQLPFCVVPPRTTLSVLGMM